MGLDDYKISRRSLLLGSGSVAALAALAHPDLFAAAVSGLHAMADLSGIRYIVTDKRHAQSLAFAQPYIAQGSQALEVTDGLTRVWQQSLEPLWQQRGGAVAGLTMRATWEILAEQARSHALRTRVLVPLADNDGRPDNLVSWVIA